MTKALSRRQAMVALGALGTGSVLSASRLLDGAFDGLGSVGRAEAASCVLTPEQTEGPYYIDDEPFRKNITEGRPGMPLILVLRAVNAVTCAPIPNAVIEIWHADASGAYSGFNGQSNGTFMRGQQVTGAGGRVRFRTVYPGWYSGRTTHIHVKVHAGGSTVHTGQLYFDDTITDQVYATQPYASRGQRDTDNASDGIYRSGGASSLLTLTTRASGYLGRLTMGVQP
ncbi:intradiol ring-cleavage dioxygenase [Candidatus Binatia bacterium]|jgi:protocatechuate 3,4-dioxygenase beta subunit|nr:intradiol ring-cleavage dioxygenase [Candidatus Binatia bacterium]